MEAGPGLFWVGAVIYVLLFSATGFWFMRAQMQYLRLYRWIVNPDLPLLPEEWGARYFRQPHRWFIDTPGLFWQLRHVGSERHTDPELEERRQEANRRSRWLWAIMIFGAPIPVIFSSISS